MKILHRCLLYCLLAVVLTVLAEGCTSRPMSPVVSRQDSQLRRYNDSLLWLARKSRQVERVFAIVDSLQQEGAIGPVRADYERGNIYYMLNRKRQGERYWRRALKSEYTTPDEERYYFSTATYLVNKLQVKHDFDGALQVAIKTSAQMKQSKMVKPINIGIQLGDVGICQLKTHRIADARKSFQESSVYLQKAIETDSTLHSITNALVVIGNTIIFCLDAKCYDETAKWLEYDDSLLAVYCRRPDADSLYADIHYNRHYTRMARLLFAQGKKREAEKMFRKAKATKSYQQKIERTAGEYLLEAGRYAEAVESYADIENDIRRHTEHVTLDIIQQYLFPKFRANVGAGNRDSSIVIADRIFQALDSAIAWQKQDDAAELAVIYETQGKDQQIAQQQATLTSQKLRMTILVSSLVVLSLVIFIYFRYRAAKRLKAEHNKLLDAYDQLEETTAAKERYESELRIARDIQMSMVPSEFPQRDDLDMYAVMMPAREVGGDLYGYILKDDMLYFAIGDVSGKGVPASLFMAQTIRLFQTLAGQGMQPADICTQMNKALSGADNASGMFVTFFLGLLDLHTGHLSFCNCGHNPPVLGGGADQGTFLKMEPNAPLGLWPDLQFAGEAIDTIKGRPLFLYTDGLNEAEDVQQHRLGDDRLLAILRHTRFVNSRQIIETLTAAVADHRAGAEPNDDLTMLCLHLS